MTVFASGVQGPPEAHLQRRFSIVEIEGLKVHEEVDLRRSEVLTREIESDGFLRRPIVVDVDTNAVIDGHHRLHALRQLGCKRVPAILIDYGSPCVEVEPWREGEELTKVSVLEAANSGRRLPPRTSKHLVFLNGVLEHISTMEKEINFPLERLKE